jgi:hypothetical protein
MEDSIGQGVRTPEAEKLTGIAGWLAFALVMLFLQAVGFLFAMVSPFVTQSLTPEKSIDVAISAALFLYTIFIIISFFAEKRRTKLLAVILYAIICAFGLLSLSFGYLNSASGDAMRAAAEGIKSIVISLAWIAYFIRSQRVKNTFVN